MRDAPAKRSTTIPPGAVWRLDLRVYYEDTDFSGFVYHASYLRFLERARTEWLRAIGFEQGELKQADAVAFAVRRIEIDYIRPAKMDDSLSVETRMRRLGGASIDFEQTIMRGVEQLVAAFVAVAMLKDGRPSRIPLQMKKRIVQAAAERSARERSNPAHLQRPIEPRDD